MRRGQPREQGAMGHALRHAMQVYAGVRLHQPAPERVQGRTIDAAWTFYHAFGFCAALGLSRLQRKRFAEILLEQLALFLTGHAPFHDAKSLLAPSRSATPFGRSR